jgi:phospholipase C
MAHNRRKFLQLLGAGVAAAAFPPSVTRALSIPAHHRTGTIEDVEHIVILMQENRSFDHYFGTLRGVRGFGDPRAVNLPSGDPIWYQPNGSGFVAPFHPDAPDLGAQFLVDLPHGWTDTHDAWNQGKYDRWIPTKGEPTMAYLKRTDLPYHFALADAFTICDAYFCSLMGATDPNRYHMWTGWVGNDGQGGGPVVDNSEAGYDWHTFPERLQHAGISWKIYQDRGAGLDAEHFWGWGDDAYVGNYGDNSLLYFHQYQNAQPGSPLFEAALRGTDVASGGALVDIFKRDVLANELPQVSWIVAPETYSEHGNWPTNYGAWYIDQFLDALTANPDVWSKTALFLTYDENDGFFDHLVPPTPPQNRTQGLSTIETTNEIFPGNADYASGPYGFGVRVPMIVISPWSKGGWVSSEVCDHTSLIRFIEQRFARQHPELFETNITAWRRAVAGDLTSAFNFGFARNAVVPLPSTVGYAPVDRERHPDYVPAIPANQTLPAQERGVRPARALPYELQAEGRLDAPHRAIEIDFANTGHAAAVFHVRSGIGQDGPWTYTVGAHAKLSDTWTPVDGSYDLSVYGPNGFLRTFKGDAASNEVANLDVKATYRGEEGISLELRNRGKAPASVAIWDAYAEKRTTQLLKPGEAWSHDWPLLGSLGWYDFTIEVEHDASFVRCLAGHVESGKDGISDPALGASS